MQNFGYKNWEEGMNFDESYEDNSSPPTYTSDPYGFEVTKTEKTKNKFNQNNLNSNINSNKIKTTNSNNLYNYNLSDDEDEESNDYNEYLINNNQKNKNKVLGSNNNNSKRMSTNDRISQILEKSKQQKQTIVDSSLDQTGDEDDAYNSWKSSWNQLMEGVGSSPGAPLTNDESQDEISPLKDLNKNKKNTRKQSFDVSDSLDISDGDFEVGAIAARRSQEKSNERKRRAAMESVPTKYSDSPNVSNKVSIY